MTNIAPTQAQAPAAQKEQIRLYLSGGSNRSALGSVGAILFLIQNTQGQYRWRDVDEVVGVSGGSQPLAAMMAALHPSGKTSSYTDDDARTKEALRGFYGAFVKHRFHLTSVVRIGLFLLVAAVALSPVALFFGSVLLPGPIAFILGLVLMAVVYRVGSFVLSSYLKSIVGAYIRGASKAGARASMRELTTAGKKLKGVRRDYFIGTAGLATGSNYFYWVGQGPDAAGGQPRHPSDADDDASPTLASHASCSLPPLSRRRRRPAEGPWKKPDPQTNAAHLAKVLPDKEALLDGGYGGNFGLQIVDRAAKDIAGAAKISAPLQRRILAVDGGRRVGVSAKFAAVLMRMVSTVMRLLRIVQVSSDAVYVNDIQDLEDVNGGILELSRVGVGVSPKTTTPANDAALKTISKQLRNASHHNAKMALLPVRRLDAHLAVAMGVVGMYLAEAVRRDELGQATVSVADLKSHLETVENDLGATAPGLLRVWEVASVLHKDKKLKDHL